MQTARTFNPDRFTLRELCTYREDENLRRGIAHVTHEWDISEACRTLNIEEPAVIDDPTLDSFARMSTRVPDRVVVNSQKINTLRRPAHFSYWRDDVPTMEKALGHELIHHWQVKYSYGAEQMEIWNATLPYNERPHELEAHELEERIAPLIKRRSLRDQCRIKAA